MNDAIARALSDLDAARAVCVEALNAPHAFPIDKIKAASELRLIARERIALLDRQAEEEAERRQRAETGCWT
jgi:hypothetical protein